MRPPPVTSRFLPLAAALVFCAGAVSAQSAYRVKDIVTATATGSVSVPGPLAPFGSAVYFGAGNQASAEQLWKSDGTPQGTRRLRDFDVLGYPPPTGFTALGSRLFFFVDGGLWEAGGSEEPSLVRKLPSSGVPYAVAAAGPYLYFTFDDGVHGFELWKSDGSADGTSIVADIEPGAGGSVPSWLTAVGDQLFFFAGDTVHGGALWRTDGTESGTVRVKTLSTPPQYGQGLTATRGQVLFFIAPAGIDAPALFHLWRSDGTAAGTFVLREFVADFSSVCPGYCFPYGPSDLTTLGGLTLFIANDGTHGRELWRTDGTTAGTTLVRDVFSGEEGGAYSSLLRVGDLVFFTGEDEDHGYELWKSNGTESGTALVKDLAPGPDSSNAFPLGALGERVFFAAGDSGSELWSSDGTENGTFRIRDLSPRSLGYAYGFAEADGFAMFLTWNGNGSILWKTDGSDAGTVVIEDFAAGVSAFPSFLTDAGGRLFFSVRDGDYPTEFTKLWKSDGTEDGTTVVESFQSLFPFGLIDTSVAVKAGDLFFGASDGVHGIELWRSDGTAEGTMMVKDIMSPAPELPGRIDSYPSGFALVGQTLFFMAADADHGFELWKTDGTEEGTLLVRDIQSGSGGSVYMNSVTPFGNLLLFVADDGLHGGELWRSDGTEAGTFMVKEIAPGADWSVISRIVVLGDRALFAAYDLGRTGLYRSDGSEEGTERIAELAGSPNAGLMTVSAGLLFFFDLAESGLALWRSDGTRSGTYAIGSFQAYGSGPVDAGGTLFFAADDGVHGMELWRSDGTRQGTFMVRDTNPGLPGSAAAALASAGSLLVFAANDGAHGLEPWISDGTEAGTVMLQDIAPGPPSSSPASFVRSGDLVFFTADDGTTGFELWAIPAAALQNQLRDVVLSDRSPRPTRAIPFRQ